MWETFVPLDMLTLLLARHQQEWVAGIIVLWFKGIGYYKYGASDDRLLHLRANQVLMWEAIRLAHERGCAAFEFGRTSVANRGLTQYKDRWGATRETLHYVRLPEAVKLRTLNETSPTHRQMKRIMARMPGFALRAAGELLYKHFA
jgi:lipid II:glycine glycyltransferase (peptidoglycan interpeptide bridge formation enzyme)